MVLDTMFLLHMQTQFYKSDRATDTTLHSRRVFYLVVESFTIPTNTLNKSCNTNGFSVVGHVSNFARIISF
jgi:hypothetical protein